MQTRSVARSAAIALVAAAFGTTHLSAQSRTEEPFATRAALQARVLQADSAARNTPDRAVWQENVDKMASIRARLQDGDFNVGDRLVLRVANVPALTDTFAVRAGRVIELPDIGPIPLTGVLWSEITPYLTKNVAKFVVNPSVQAYPLIRVAVSGAVSKPGYYAIRPDMLVSDAIMTAGGTSPLADVEATTIRRNGKEFVRAKKLREQMAAGATIDQLDLRAGDEIYVAEQTKRDYAEWLRTGVYVAAMLASLYGGKRLFF